MRDFGITPSAESIARIQPEGDKGGVCGFGTMRFKVADLDAPDGVRTEIMQIITDTGIA